ncbi:MAG: glucose-6-phosphate isomerase [Proteobacteria bacterium]|nr:glucose-6-phosphate isomerase [Pseudomonadota bacterium]
MASSLWQRYQKYLCVCPDIELSLDISRMRFDDGFIDAMSAKMAKALDDMKALESGVIANPDEKRMVGHYWLRAPELAPTPELRAEIEQTKADIKTFAADVHEGRILAPNGKKYTDLLVIGIGGSALGPQWIASALSTADDKMRVHFLDNTDPEGIDMTLSRIRDLETLLVVVISKSGSTPETRNGMISAAKYLESRGLKLANRAVAITGKGSKLDNTAKSEGWIRTFPMWDWVGGRTSELSAVGLLPAALQGIDIDALCAGAAACDVHTRNRDIAHNPAALMALMWYFATNGKGQKDLVILPYKDKLLLFARYLQQLIMESLGKALDLDGNTVHQGLTVYGNKGSTDQHAYVQQLRDGIDNFFVTFIDVLEYGAAPVEVDPNVTPGDFLHGFLLGTRQALYEGGRDSMTITVGRIDPRTIGALIALFERSVGIYASLIHINAYHQPGVEAGKKAASKILSIQTKCLEKLNDGSVLSAHELATLLDLEDEEETIYRIMTYLASNGRIHSTSNEVYDFSRRFHA